MTLVLNCLTSKYTIQVSDRRISRPDSGAVVEDDRNKGTVYCAQMAIAYSGLATLENKPTDIWIAETLRTGANLAEGLQNLRLAANSLFSSIQAPPSQKRHAFVLSGWIVDEHDRLLPSACVLSNALDDDWNWKDAADADFQPDGVRLVTRPYLLLPPVGAHVDEAHFRELENHIAKCVEHETSPMEIVRLMGAAIRRVAAATPTVNRSLLVTILPRSSVRNPVTMFSTPLSPSGSRNIETPMFFHIPADSDDLCWNIPNFVCGGNIFTGGRFEPRPGTGPDNPGWRIRVKVQ